MIIHRADMFGLAQLYQLRGRVGRAKQRGYAYLTLPKRAALTKNAYKRLEVMQGLDSLGAGFTIASHDMDIRGFGNLLGEEQSGQVKEVGVELYQKMLRETILRLRAEEDADVKLVAENKFVPNINLGISVLIPDYYVEDLDLRMGLYKRAAQLRSDEEISAFEFELIDRFGNIPQEVLSLLETMRLKNLCLQLGISKIDVGTKALVVQFIEQPYVEPEQIMRFVQQNQERVKVKMPNKLLFAIEPDSTNEQLIFSLEKDLKELLQN
jgi:transcription-repair coupling factor (superfamily II helicase)